MQIGYKYKFCPTYKETTLYGLCIYTGDNTKWKKWYAQEQKRIARNNRVANQHRIPIIRPKKAKPVHVDTGRRDTHYVAKELEVDDREEGMQHHPSNLLNDTCCI